MGNISFIRVVSKATRGSHHRCEHTRWWHVRISSLTVLPRYGQSGGNPGVRPLGRTSGQRFVNIPSDIGNRATRNDRIGHFVGFTPRALLWSPTSAPRPSNRAPSQVEVAKLTNRLMWLSDEAYSHGWTLLALT